MTELDDLLIRAEHELGPAISCERAEAIIAARLAGPVSAASEGALAGHLDGCPQCGELAEAAGGAEVGDLILDFGAVPEPDLAELVAVPRDLYVRGHEVGRGGMGRIVRARDRRLGRAVAIKELLDERLRARFEREARLTARLQHPGVVNVLEAGRWEDGAPFYAMKYVAGRPLSEALAGRSTLAGRLGYLPNLIAAVDAVAYAHSERIVHRDLKPHNIVVGPFGETVVIDWGLAKDLTDDDTDDEPAPLALVEDRLTRAGAGTPGYMPPEQARGDAPDERVDVYALGATLYHLLAGHPPDAPIAQACPDAPLELAAIVDKAMDPDPLRRYLSAAELADELKRFQTGQLVRAHQYSLGELLRRWLRRHRFPLVVAAVATALVAAIGVLGLSQVLEARRGALAERDRTERAHGDLLVELARQDLLAGAAADAASKLDEARALGVDDVTSRFLAAEAQRRLWRRVRSLPGAVLLFPETAMAFTSERQLVLGAGPNLLVWDVQTGGVAATLVGAPLAPSLPRRLEVSGEQILDVRGGSARLWSLGVPRAVDAAEVHLVGDSGWLLERGATLVLRDGPHDVLTVRPLEGKRFAAAALAPSFQRIATVEDTGLLVLWNGAGEAPRRLGRSPANRLLFSPTSRTLLALGGGEATLWDVDRAVVLGRFRGEPAAELRWSPDGEVLAIVDPERRVRLLDRRGELRGIVPLDGRPVLVELVGDSTRLLTVAGSTAALWDTMGRPLSTSRLPGAAHAAALPPEGELLAVAGSDGTSIYKLPQAVPGVYLWDTGIAAHAWAPDGRLAVVDTQGSILLYDARGRSLLRAPSPLPRTGTITPAVTWLASGAVVALAPDGSVAVVAGGARVDHPASGERGFATSRGLQVVTRDRLERWGEDGVAHPVALPPGVTRVHHVDRDGSFAIVELGGRLARADLANGKLIPLGQGTDPLVSPDGRWLAVRQPDRIELWDIPSAQIAGHLPVTHQTPVAFAGPDLVVTAPPGSPERWSLAGRREALPGESVPVFRGDGALFAQITAAGRMRLVAGTRAVAEYPPMTPVSFSPDGQRLLVALGQELRVLDVSEASRSGSRSVTPL